MQVRRGPPYWLRVLVAWDMALNVTLGGRFDETVSARAGRARGKVWGCVVCLILDWVLGPRHCQGAVLADIRRAEAAERDLRC